MVSRELPRLHHGAQRATHLGHFLGPGIERDHRGTAPGRLECMPAEPAPEIQEAIARAHAELVIVHGQHPTSPFDSAVVAASTGSATGGDPGNGFPSSNAS